MANEDIPAPKRPKQISGKRRRFVKKLGKKAMRWASNVQEKASLVPTTPFLDAGQFDFLTEFEDRWREIEKEARAVLEFRDQIPGFEDISPDQYKIAKANQWKTFVLFGFGTRLEKNTEHTPVSAEILEKVPNLQTAWYSILAPGYHIPAHTGVTKGILRAHLGLIIPKDYKNCRIRVGDQVNPWREGEMLLLDDTYEHEVWNETDEERVILLFDFDRPMKWPGRFLNKIMMRLMKMTAYYQDPKKNLANAEDRFENAVKQASANLEAMSD